MMNLDKYINLLTEEIVGNLATVYHRGDKNKLNRLLNQTYQNQSHIDFKYYDKALYTTTDMASQLNQGGHQFNNMKKIYGDYIIKLVFKGISNCWFCDYDEYRKFNNCTIDNWKEQQFKKFNIAKEEQSVLAGRNKRYTENHADISRYFEKRNLLGKRVKGIQYKGAGDGNCLLIYDWSTAIPITVSNDEGKTWEKVDKSKTSFSRSNFNKNDYIDTTSKSTKIDFNMFIDKNGNLDCSGREDEFGSLKSLQGAPKEVKGNFNCSYNKLESLQGAPEKVGGDFDCSVTWITSLQGAPKVVGGDFNCGGESQEFSTLQSLQGAPKIVRGNFDCSRNQLESLQGAPKIVGGDFNCSYNKLESLQGAPEKVGGNFNCGYNELTSLQGAPKVVGGYFACDGKISKKELLRYLKAARIEGDIYTNIYDFNSQEEAIKKLSGLNEEIFNY